MRQAIAGFAVLLACAPAWAQSRGAEIIERETAMFCEALKGVASAMAQGGLPAAWDTLPAYQALRRPDGGSNTWNCSLEKADGRDGLACEIKTVESPDSVIPVFGERRLEPCLAGPGWTVRVTERDNGEEIHRFTQEGSGVEVTGIHTPVNIVTRIERLIVSGPAKQ